ncbi:hypothetical protein Bca4012_034096 [Brassica carinata]
MWAMGLLKLMNGEYLMEHQNFLDVSKLPPYHLQPKYNLAEKLCIDLFKDVGQVVHVRLLVDCEGNQIGDGYVEFASSKEAEQALQKKYCIDHQVWYEDYLARENRLIQEDEAVEEGFDETCDFAEEVALRKNRIFVYNLPPRIRKNNLIFYYKDVGEVRRVRLVVNREGEHVGCAFVEFSSAEEAKKALVHESKTLIILSDVVEMAPYPIRPKYILAETLWNEEYLEPLSLPIKEDYLGKQEVTKLFCGKKKTFSEDD